VTYPRRPIVWRDDQLYIDDAGRLWVTLDGSAPRHGDDDAPIVDLEDFARHAQPALPPAPPPRKDLDQ
jgi:hypothetical protein